MSVPLRQEKYQPFGDLYIDFPEHGECSDYRRQLDIDSGLSTVRYRVGEVTFTREVFSSFPDQVIVVHRGCDKPGQVTFTAKLDSPHPGTETLIVDEALTMRGQLREYMDKRSNSNKTSVLKFEARLGWRARGGQAEATAGGVDVKGADSVMLVLAAATSFRNFQDVSGDPAVCCQRDLKAVERKSYDDLHDRHIADHRRLFRSRLLLRYRRWNAVASYWEYLLISVRRVVLRGHSQQ